jgi:hypothetical protein
MSLTEDGTKRIITKTGVYSGTELHMWAVPPYFDDRLPVRGDRPDLSFNVQRREIAATEEWQEVRWGAGDGRQRLTRGFLLGQAAG